MRLALVTCRELSTPIAEDLILIEALESMGAQVKLAVWDDPSVDWASYEMAVLRTAWDYHLKFELFTAWLVSAENATRVVNSPNLIRWNWKKSYLLELAEKGVPVVETMYFSIGSACHLQIGSDSPVVIKPAIGATAYRTQVFDPAQRLEAKDHFNTLLAEGDVMIQPYLSEIETEGEISLVFFGGKFSHAARKYPAMGDYRVQTEHGGRSIPVEPTSRELAVAERAIAATPEVPVYARVDLVGIEEPKLIELEMIEPELFFPLYPDSAATLANLLVRTAPSFTQVEA